MNKETLLQRLRQYEGEQSQTTACYNGLRDEAADEIDQLRLRLVKAVENRRRTLVRAVAIEDDRDRLREALEHIAAGDFAELAAENARLRGAARQLEINQGHSPAERDRLREALISIDTDLRIPPWVRRIASEALASGVFPSGKTETDRAALAKEAGQ